MEKKNKGLVVLVIVLIILLLGLGGYVVYDKVITNKNQSSSADQKFNQNKNVKGVEEQKDNVYGYAIINNDSESKVVELHSNINNKVISTLNDRIYSFTMKHNKLFYYSQSANENYLEKTFYIDLSDSNLKSVELTSGVDVEYYFDFDENNLYTAMQKSGIKKYNFNSKQEEYIAQNVGAFEVFVANNKIYATTYDESSNEKYYTILNNGNEFTWINQNEYDNAKKSIQYKKVVENYSDMYYFYNNNKVSLTSDRKEIMYGDKSIFKASDGKVIELKYTTTPNEIAFGEYIFENYQAIEEKYYKYNLSTNNLTETTNNEIYNVELIIN